MMSTKGICVRCAEKVSVVCFTSTQYAQSTHSPWPSFAHHSSYCKVGADALLSAILPNIFESPYAGGNEMSRLHLAQLLVKVTELHAARLLSPSLTCPGARHVPAPSIDGLALALLADAWMDAEVLARAKTERKHLLWLTLSLGQRCVALTGRIGARIIVASPILHQSLQLCQGLFDLGHSARAIDELARSWVEALVRHNETEQRDGLAGARGHLEHAVSIGIERAFEIGHVRILLWIDLGVREEDGQVVDVELHVGLLKWMVVLVFGEDNGGGGGGDSGTMQSTAWTAQERRKIWIPASTTDHEDDGGGEVRTMRLLANTTAEMTCKDEW